MPDYPSDTQLAEAREAGKALNVRPSGRDVVVQIQYELEGEKAVHETYRGVFDSDASMTKLRTDIDNLLAKLAAPRPS